MLASSQVFHILKFAAPLLIICWTTYYFSTSTTAYTQVLRKFKDEKELFISDFLEHEVDGVFDGSGITAVCTNRTWTPGLFLSCESPPGGLAVVKNAHLNCIRFAIEMGAELILPGIVPRNEHDISKISPVSKAPIHGNDLDYFFDAGHLNRSMTTYCPQLRLHRSINDLWEVPSLLQAIKIEIGEVGIELDETNKMIISHPEAVSALLTKYINTKSPPRDRKHPVHFKMKPVNFIWPTNHDGPAFARHFGRVLRIRTDARRIAAAALFNLHKRFSLDIDPRHALSTEKSFVGVHLRTEKDTLALTEFPVYEEQASYYLDDAVGYNATVIYLATGASEQNITSFVDRAMDFGITTVLKEDILDPEDVSVLKKFTYDQKSLVDYEIMLRAGLMTGTSESPFAWNLAMRRGNAFRHGAVVEEEGKSDLGSYREYRDKYSTIFGKSKKGPVFQATIWP